MLDVQKIPLFNSSFEWASENMLYIVHKVTKKYKKSKQQMSSSTTKTLLHLQDMAVI